MFTPQPLSLPAGERHHRPSTLSAAAGGVVTSVTCPVLRAKFVGELLAVLPPRSRELSPSVGAAGCCQTSEPSAQSISPPPGKKNPFGTTKSGVTTPRAANPCVPKSILRPEVSPGRLFGTVKRCVTPPELDVSWWPATNSCALVMAVSSRNWTEPSALE